MKQVIGTFFNDREEDFKTFVQIFEDAGYEVARQGGICQAVVITEVPDEEPEVAPEVEGE